MADSSAIRIRGGGKTHNALTTFSMKPRRGATIGASTAGKMDFIRCPVCGHQTTSTNMTLHMLRCVGTEPSRGALHQPDDDPDEHDGECMTARKRFQLHDAGEGLSPPVVARGLKSRLMRRVSCSRVSGCD